MAKQLVINPFTEEMLSSMQHLLEDVRDKLADALDLAESSEAECGHQCPQASSPPAWWADLVDRLHVLSNYHDECCTAEYYYGNDVPDASRSFEAFKEACEIISSMINAKVNEYYGECISLPTRPLVSRGGVARA